MAQEAGKLPGQPWRDRVQGQLGTKRERGLRFPFPQAGRQRAVEAYGKGGPEQ